MFLSTTRIWRLKSSHASLKLLPNSYEFLPKQTGGATGGWFVINLTQVMSKAIARYSETCSVSRKVELG